jgi:hypothetical protein
MKDAGDKTGYFVFSLDTELAFGHFDDFDPKNFSSDGQRERQAIVRLLDILDEFKIIATWAIVGHLFLSRCEECEICPIMKWKGKYQSFAQIHRTSKPLWYGADIVDTLLTRGVKHEIAFHGYSHEVFDEKTMSKDQARIEIREWIRLSKQKGIIPLSVIFPRDKVGHLDLFKESGFICFRSDEELPILHRPLYLGSIIKTIDHILSISTPLVYDLSIVPPGLVSHRQSQHLFGFNRRIEKMLDLLNLHTLRIRRVVKGLKKAAEEKKILHIWAHPWEFRSEQDFEKLRHIFDHVSDEVSRGRIRSVAMADLTKEKMG